MEIRATAFEATALAKLQISEIVNAVEFQEIAGGARGCAAAHANNGRGEWRKRAGRTDVPVTSGITIDEDGGKPKDGAGVKQNGQCSKCVPLSAGAELRTGDAFWTLTPCAVQISCKTAEPALRAANACEIEGASEAIRIARQAIHAVMRRVYRSNSMLKVQPGDENCPAVAV